MISELIDPAILGFILVGVIISQTLPEIKFSKNK